MVKTGNILSQEDVVQKLHEINEERLGRKKPTKKKSENEGSKAEVKSEEIKARQEKNRKRKERRKRKREINSVEDVDESVVPKKSAIVDIVKMFGLNEKQAKVKNDSKINNEDDIESNDTVTRVKVSSKHSSKTITNRKEETEIFVFHNPQKRKKKKPNKTEIMEDVVEEPKGIETPVFDMDAAKFEVQKLGITGFEETKQEESMVNLLVSLGAKPPKKKYVNYKELMKQRKEEIIKDKEKREMDRKLGFRVKKGSHKKEKRDVNDINIRDGVIGRYENGTQYIKKRQLPSKQFSQNK